MAKRTVVPAKTREGEFATGGTGGFSALESYQRMRTTADEKAEVALRAAYKAGLETGDWKPFQTQTATMLAKGYSKDTVDRLVRSASFQGKR